MKAFGTLPEGYSEILRIDLQKSRKLMLLINGVALAIAIVMFFIGTTIVPLTALFDISAGRSGLLARLIVLIVGSVAYIVLHELTHAAVMKLCGTKKVRFGFTGGYAFAGSEDYYARLPYICIALAPVVLLGIVVAVINALVPPGWFWVLYFFQIFNISGAAGDYYVSLRFAGLPKDILVRDYGVAMRVYSKKGK